MPNPLFIICLLPKKYKTLRILRLTLVQDFICTIVSCAAPQNQLSRGVRECQELLFFRTFDFFSFSPHRLAICFGSFGAICKTHDFTLRKL